MMTIDPVWTIVPVAVIIIGWAVYDIQHWLEARDYRRHCND